MATINGTTDNDTLTSLAAADILNGLEGDDTLYGGAGSDTLNGGDDDDVLAGGGEADVLNGGAGTDVADYSASAAGVTVSLASGTGSGGDAQGDTLTQVENLVGSAQGDSLTGDGNANQLDGGAGADLLDGGAGIDTADYATALMGVTVNMAFVSANTGDAVDDTFIAIESLSGSDFDDTLVGDGNANRLSGVEGNDTLNGMGGIDYLVGGAGDDVLAGGAGADVFVFNPGFGHDTITDFWAGPTRTDRVQLIGTDLGNFTEVQTAFTQTVNGALLSMDGGAGTILFAGVAVSSFVADDFVFA